MKLVIAEKPSVAQAIAVVIGADQRRDGYLEGNGYKVSWCIGHLAGLASADVYEPRYAKWRYEDLPIIPREWKLAVGKEKQKQFDILKRLMNASDVDSVINACDAGREGEAIFRTVYELAGCQKPMERLWISSMEDEAIRRGFLELKSGSEYEGLHQAALCRNRADWLVGINATRLFSVLYRRKLNVGRVMSPTLALIVKREVEIDSFKPQPFYTVTLETSDLAAVSERLQERAEAEALKAAIQGGQAVVEKVECKKKTEKPPVLYDLTSLQRDANRLLGFTAQQTLDYLQALYEKKLCTYPRTDSRYLTSDMAGTISELIEIVSEKIPGMRERIGKTEVSRVINDKKVTDHHAVIPTKLFGKESLSTLPTGEQLILELVALRLLCAVSVPFEYAETVVKLNACDHLFSTKGQVVLSLGWKAIEDACKFGNQFREPDEKVEKKPLPELSEGQGVEVTGSSVKEGKTTPPKHYTEDTLLSAMENAGEKDKMNFPKGGRGDGLGQMPEDAERKGLGTPATRAGILEKLVSIGFVERKKSKKTVQLIPTQAAVALITVLPEQLQSPHLTAEWEYKLLEMERGRLKPEVFMDEITAMLKDLVATYHAVTETGVTFPSEREVVGKCPRCGSDVTERKQGFFCENAGCKFALWKNSKFFSAKKKQLTKTVAVSLLKDGRVQMKGCYSEKTGKSYDATVVLADDGEYVNFKLEFSNTKA